MYCKSLAFAKKHVNEVVINGESLIVGIMASLSA